MREAEVDGFFHWLIQSALVRKHFLERCQADGNSSSPYRRASLAAPFFDAVTATQWKLARKVAALSADTWVPGEEYEDDFAHARFLYLLVHFEAPDRVALTDALEQFERALEATALGLRTQPEYRFCPGLVRRVGYAPFKPLAFPLTP